jgi:Ca2+-binding RTX toxin-like protein
MHDGNTVAGGQLTVSANTLRADETVRFDGSAETNGRYRIFSGDGADLLRGGDGADELWGRGGNDTIQGGGGADLLRGGSGSDMFVYADGDSTRLATDQIFDFASGDLLDLRTIDANAGVEGDQRFTFIGTGGFSGTAGELRAFQDGARWIVEGDVDGDGQADLVIAVTRIDANPLTSFDILL